MWRERDQTRVRHYLVAIVWFAAALAIYSGKHLHAQRIEAEYQKALAEEEATAAASPNSPSLDTRRRKLLPGETVVVHNCCIEIRREHLEVDFGAVARQLLFAVAGFLMFWGYRARLASLIIGTWTACFWLVQHWHMLLPRSEWSNAILS